jgi:hypothetical protein
VRIEFERHGGFAGVPLHTSLDTAALPADEAHEIEQLVDEGSVFSLPETSAEASGGADQFLYKLTVTQGSKRRVVSLSERQVPDSLRPLLVRLTALARRTA